MTPDTYEPPDGTIVSMRKATLRIRQRLILQDTSWAVKQRQHWAVLGPNGAGKTTLVRALTGDVPVVRGTLWPRDTGGLRAKCAYVSFDQHVRLMTREERLDESRWYSGRVDEITSVAQYLMRGLPPNMGRAQLVAVLEGLQADHLLHHGIGHLSSGEFRRVLIARALLRQPRILILDEPYSGLDRQSAARAAAIVDGLMTGPHPVIMVTHRVEEIPPHATHVLGVKEGRVVFQGPREVVLRDRRLESLYARKAAAPSAVRGGSKTPAQDFSGAAPLLEMKAARVSYRDRTVIGNLSWTLRQGENWALLGPNGSGKTTLLNLIYGEHPQVYANHVWLFGRRRGSGESVWEIKERIGLVSAELQVRYRKPATALEAVVSGFRDTVGLYRRPRRSQLDAARHWMRAIGIESLAQRRFERLSTGEQRLVLIARAMVKTPRILMLDEPTQSLDPVNRSRILSAVDRICSDPAVTVIFASHFPDELPKRTTHVMTLIPSEGGSVGRIRRLGGD